MNEVDEDAVEARGAGEDATDESDAEEAVASQIMTDPGQPTAKEREEHEFTNFPPRQRCKWCLYGKGQHDHHRFVVRMDGPEEIAIPAISLDYCFMGTRNTRAVDNPILVAFDNRTNALAAWQVFEKGAVGWVAGDVARFIGSLGYDKMRVTLKSDGEIPITALQNLVAQTTEAPTVVVETAARESKSNGAMDVRVKSWQAQFKTMLADLQSCIGCKIPLGNKVISWLVIWAATTLNKYKMDAAGRTAFQRVTGGTQRRPIAMFGRRVLWMPKAESNVFEGVFIGIKGLSTEAVTATEEGVVHARTARRRRLEER